MARIPLRAYNREIEDLIDHDQYDQAIAHCKHILVFFSKHIDTYRLLGKAYLESQRYGDAADVFQRVLSSVPEDFVAHLGMSLIREDEGNLDEAIWHMERAFEMQPANAAVQGEIRRLYERRDGLEPHKIRLTRGALARMYVKGDLYPQAIAELRAALVEDPQRLDLQVLLAQAYSLAGQIVEAAETSSNLLKKLPYCLEANRLLAQILAGSERAPEAEDYRQRVQALDPYAAYISPDAPTSDNVAETNVTLEKLDWEPVQPGVGISSQPEWAASLGVNTEEMASQDSLPEWLSNPAVDEAGSEAAFEETQKSWITDIAPDAAEDFTAGAHPFETSETAEQHPQEEIPDWMKDAGWEPSSSQAEEADPGSAFDEDSPEEEIAPAEIPDWLRSAAPAEVDDEASQPTSALEDLHQFPETPQSDSPSKDFLPWLSETQPGPTDSILNWLEEKSPRKGSEDSSAGAGSDGEMEEPEIPEWIQGVGEEKSSDFDYFTPEEGAAPIDLPDWLTGVEPEETSSEIPDWLKSVADQPEAAADMEAGLQGASAEDTEAANGDQEPIEDEVPEWRVESPILPDAAEIQDEAGAGEPAVEENPDWLKGIEAEAAQSIGVSEGRSGDLEPAGAENEEGAFDWLEGLADRQVAGAALFPAAEEPPEPDHDWAADETLSGESLPASLEATPTIDPTDSLDTGVTVEMSDRFEAQTSPLEGDELPDWMRQSAGQSEFEASGAENRAVYEDETGLPQADLPDWLQELAPASPPAPTGSSPGLVGVFPFEAGEGADTPAETGEIPEWLREVVPVESDEAGASMDVTTETALQQGALAEVPGWLGGLDEGPVSEEDTKPTRISQAREVPIPPELSEFLTAPPAEDQSAFGTPEELIQEPTLEEGLEAEREPGVEEPSPGEEIISSAGSEEIPDWLGLLGEEPAGQEQPVSEPGAEEYTGLEPERPPVETSLEPGSEEQDTAYDWLDSLADQQEDAFAAPGAGTEAPLPVGAQVFEAAFTVEPVDIMPEAGEAADQTRQDETAGLETVISGAMIFKAAELSSLEEPAGETFEAASLEVPTEEPLAIDAPLSDLNAGQDIQDELEEDLEPAGSYLGGTEAEGGTGLSFDEQPAAEGATDLPGWLYREEEAPGFEGQSWPSPAEAEAEPEWAGEVSPEVSASQATNAESGLLDLNQAALIELEQVPGIGLLGAQAILAYRESHGRFSSLEDLRNVPGFEEETIAQLRERVTVLQPAQADVDDIFMDRSQIALAQARNAIAQSSRQEALDHYAALIKARTLLPEVIQDLHEALYRFQNDVPLLQALGDAYARNDQLQDALDTYTKAEELLR